MFRIPRDINNIIGLNLANLDQLRLFPGQPTSRVQVSAPTFPPVAHCIRLEKNEVDLKLGGDDVCAICHEGMFISNSATMSCDHVFHVECVNAWRETSCPLCRTEYYQVSHKAPCRQLHPKELFMMRISPILRRLANARQ